VANKKVNIGTSHPNSKLTPNQVRLIRHLHPIGVALRAEASEYSHHSLGERFGVAAQTVYDVVAFRSYREIPEPEDICDECGADFTGMDAWQQMEHNCG